MLYNSLVICILTISAVSKTYNGCLGNRSAYSWPGSRIDKLFLRRGVHKVSFVFEQCKGENGLKKALERFQTNTDYCPFSGIDNETISWRHPLLTNQLRDLQSLSGSPCWTLVQTALLSFKMPFYSVSFSIKLAVKYYILWTVDIPHSHPHVYLLNLLSVGSQPKPVCAELHLMMQHKFGFPL